MSCRGKQLDCCTLFHLRRPSTLLLHLRCDDCCGVCVAVCASLFVSAVFLLLSGCLSAGICNFLFVLNRISLMKSGISVPVIVGLSVCDCVCDCECDCVCDCGAVYDCGSSHGRRTDPVSRQRSQKNVLPLFSSTDKCVLCSSP